MSEHLTQAEFAAINNSAILYFLARDGQDGWKVINRNFGRAAFYGSLSECREWLEHNGHDEFN